MVILWTLAVFGAFGAASLLTIIIVCAAVWRDGSEPNVSGLHGRHD